MPIYEYVCEGCLEEFEVLQSMRDAGPDHCSRCGGRLERKHSLPNSNFRKFSSSSAERYSKLTVQQQARKELNRLSEHSKKTGIPLNDLFEVH
ncbi:MAG TPA: FmdB family zinc ribbon protein [Pyrinomonadaceae bacterium]|nr:FmdB family zinc ribbon protein [Pyrinomonadaceae bacterium]